ncbi:phosphonate metabolism protein/1,5-bisphosphokinase (PRPP-forming) PhnN [Limoniibacter endophyticus]|uniref:Ribose 1,5-bisphosphate phosphokinase PhnN n=1 Tax=Limoniibacter endophyticus TaxID=1565040 RepID=A0A8J3DFP9_9HYPH|nr:phosphonate metabolism protein/1,5-bisphosphokinase (PRPP-forming) PhnN [Limoniibacter endophyticus]GHC66893.1 ribose 1,5-bisphosphate phosphokinase PhnN [Limoniibacter endophyticus]
MTSPVLHTPFDERRLTVEDQGGKGVFIAVVGPSGAGKDTVIDYARERFSKESVLFARRIITRPATAPGEDHEALSVEAFCAARETGAFALSWEAHGLHYGLPTELDSAIAQGSVVIANLSRAVIPALRDRYRTVVVVEITAQPEILVQRLANRGRETADDVAARMSRSKAVSAGERVVSIDNSGSVEQAGDKFVAIIRRALAASDLGQLI